MHGWSGGGPRAAAPPGRRSPSSPDPGRSSGSPFRDPAGSSVLHRGRDGPQGLPYLKPPAVTVRKLQKWMYKGRLLSLGMKGRTRRTPPEVPGVQAASPDLGALQVRESHVLSVPPDQRIRLTGRIPSLSKCEVFEPDCLPSRFWLQSEAEARFCRQVPAGARVSAMSVAASRDLEVTHCNAFPPFPLRF